MEDVYNSSNTAASGGFTLIELSIVLVIIGLIVGGVLVGQDLIRSAEVRATITQIEKFNTAANTFRGKYGYLPGDIKDPDASNFGFQARGQYEGEGDGNGVLEGVYANSPGSSYGFGQGAGETVMFWVDLSAAHLIDGGFNTASSTSMNTASDIVGTALQSYLPSAKVGKGNFIYVYGGALYNGGWTNTGINYFGLSAMNKIASSSYYGWPTSTVGLTVQQAYSIDKKIDDGLPQSGNVTAQYLSELVGSTIVNMTSAWAAGNGTLGASTAYYNPTNAATPGTSTTCYDNGSTTGATQQYSVEISNGSNVNCALSFRFQ